MKELTRTQIAVIEIMRERGADFIAAATENDWKNGRAAFVDDRAIGAIKGFIKMFNRANLQATGDHKCPTE